MATRLNYSLTIWRHLLADTATRLRRGSLADRVAQDGPPFVIVTGPGRSGTSAVARVLHESGFPMGREFAEASDMNLVGFYEEAPVRDLNDRIIFECGLKRLRRWPWRSTLLAIAERYGPEMNALARDAVGGWKDPQFTTTLEAWLPHLTRCPKIVICLRSPDAYVESVVRAAGMHEPELLRKRWAQQYERILDVIRAYQLDATCVEYDELVQDPQTVVAALSEFVGHPLDPQYIDASLRRFRQPVLPPYLELYDRVCALSGRPRPESLTRPLETNDYLAQIAAIDKRVAAAKDVWTRAVGMPEPPFGRGEALAETRAASQAYVGTLRDAQTEVGSLAPPLALARYHELTKRAVNLERAIVEHVLAACDTSDAVDAKAVRRAVGEWRRYCSPAAVAKAERARSNERDRALQTSA